jgi:phosphate transport system substrate-binding protein
MTYLPRRVAQAIALLAAAVAVAAGVFPSASASASASTEITVKGSDTLVVLMKRWAQEYTRLRPELSIQVTGGGTGTGMAALVNRTTDICMASRPIRIAELEGAIKVFGTRPAHHPVALDALVVYVHAANPVTELSLVDLAGLFVGRIRSWDVLGGRTAPVTLYSRENSSGTYEFFKERILDGRDFASETQTLPGTAAVLAAVASDPNGIGYGGVAFGEQARPLAIRTESEARGIPPTRDMVIRGLYPIRRQLSLYLAPSADRGVSGEFVRWILSESAQAMVEEVGYYALPPLGSRP